MPTEFEELKRYVAFGEEDAHNLHTLAPLAEPILPYVVDRFYQVIFDHPEAQNVLSDGPDQIERLRLSLLNWLRGLFHGEYGDHYYQARLAIGRRHVQVGLPQKYMPLAMEVIWQELSHQLRKTDADAVDRKLTSLHKILVLDLTIMMGSYQQRHDEENRALERRAMEGKLARARHLAEIGQLAASLAHEIKNPLAGISGAIQIIGESLPAASPYKSIVRDILGQITRVDATVKDLLLYARPASPVFGNVDVNRLIARIVSVLREEPALRNIAVCFDQCNGIIAADERLLEQLMINLILNAAHASPEGSTIRVRATPNDDRFVISVTDEGCGMSPDILEQATDPFFTTKAKGTGLGLAICQRIADTHGGSMSLDSAVNKGTRVTVTFPLRSTHSECEVE